MVQAGAIPNPNLCDFFQESGDKDARGTVLKLQNHTVVVEKKLAEGTEILWFTF